MVHKLITPDEIDAARQAFHRVFRLPADPFGQTFTDITPVRGLLFPTNYWLQEEHYPAVTRAANALGDDFIYFSEIWGYDGSDFGLSQHWSIESTLTDAGPEMTKQGASFMVESAYYSPSANWGIMTSHEIHAVFGGPPEFVAIIAASIDLDKCLEDFLSYHLDNHKKYRWRIIWIPTLLRHLYGPQRANHLLHESGLSTYLDRISPSDPDPWPPYHPNWRRRSPP